MMNAGHHPGERNREDRQLLPATSSSVTRAGVFAAHRRSTPNFDLCVDDERDGDLVKSLHRHVRLKSLHGVEHLINSVKGGRKRLGACAHFISHLKDGGKHAGEVNMARRKTLSPFALLFYFLI